MTTSPDSMIERAARSVYEKRNGRGCVAWGRLPDSHKAPYRDDVRAVLDTLETPTDSMVDMQMERHFPSQYRTGIDVDHARKVIVADHAAMIRAAKEGK